MKRRDFLKNCAIAALGYAAPGSLSANAKSLFANKSTKLDISSFIPNNSSRPNIILCMADDLGRGDVAYNGHPVIKTPNLDIMSQSGIRFDRWYTGAPVCSPTRGSCVTGRHPYRYGINTANDGNMRPKEITLAEALKTQGYTTGHFGKWHLGTLTTEINDANRGAPGNTADFSPPWVNGFDVCFSTESKVPTWNPMYNPGTTNFYGTRYWIGQDTFVPINDPSLQGDDSKVIMDRAIPFIRNAAASSKPFFAVIWFHTCHLPIVAGGTYKQMYQDLGYTGEKLNYYGCITAMDDQIGRLRTELKNLNVDNNTMIWFSSDNGPEGNDSDPGTTGHGTDKLRGRKRDLYEGGVRVPGLLFWPAKIPNQRIVTMPCSTLDYYPTILDVIGFQMPNQVLPIDGVSLKPLIEGTMTQRPGPIGFQHPGGQRALTDNQYKLISTDNGLTYQLYDIINDKSETTNIASQHPDIVNTMKIQLEQWIVSCANSDAGGDYD